jgi:hypothetical protein
MSLIPPPGSSMPPGAGSVPAAPANPAAGASTEVAAPSSPVGSGAAVGGGTIEPLRNEPRDKQLDDVAVIQAPGGYYDGPDDTSIGSSAVAAKLGHGHDRNV